MLGNPISNLELLEDAMTTLQKMFFIGQLSTILHGLPEASRSLLPHARGLLAAALMPGEKRQSLHTLE